MNNFVLPSNRELLGDALFRAGYTGAGAEIGVQRALNAYSLVSTSRLSPFFLIDPWKHFGTGEYSKCEDFSQEKHETIFNDAKNRMSVFKERVVFVRKTSHEAVLDFKNESLDFLYIDGNHSYEAVKRDIALWWPIVRTGGIFSGHDYRGDTVRDICFGVKRAVDEHCAEFGLKLQVISPHLITSRESPSWLIVK